MEYRDTVIYIQHYDEMFQFLFPWEGKIYQQHVFLKPERHKPLPAEYTDKQLEGVEAVLLEAAMKSIDVLADKLIPVSS